MIFPWFSMILSCFFHDQSDTKMMVSGISFYFSYCGLHITPFSHTFSTKYETNNTICIIIIGICARSAKLFWIMRVHFPWFFHRGILKFHDFGLFVKFHDFSRSGKCFFHFPGFPWFSMMLGTLKSTFHPRKYSSSRPQIILNWNAWKRIDGSELL